MRESRKKRIEERQRRIAEKKARNEAVEKQLEEDVKAAEKFTHDTTKLSIEICIHCYSYQHRLCWMLSSILQQKGNKPDIVVNVSYTPENGNPTTEEVCAFFRAKGLNLKETIIPKDKVHNRAVARNIQVGECETDWILFADSDMVYDEYFFEDLQKQLKGPLKNETKVMGADRVSLDIPFCIQYFEKDARKYPCEVPEVSKITSEWPIKWITGKNTAPGNFQLASMKAVKEIAGKKYTGKERDLWRHTKSDRAFRVRMGGRRGIHTLRQYHLNHDRGGPEIQR